jgi:hypothetical protein
LSIIENENTRREARKKNQTEMHWGQKLRKRTTFIPAPYGQWIIAPPQVA